MSPEETFSRRNIDDKRAVGLVFRLLVELLQIRYWKRRYAREGREEYQLSYVRCSLHPLPFLTRAQLDFDVGSLMRKDGAAKMYPRGRCISRRPSANVPASAWNLGSFRRGSMVRYVGNR
jgi:hypothetical protein